MITPILRLSQALDQAKKAQAEIEAEKSFGHLNRFHQSKALQYAALAEQFAALAVKHLQKINVNKTTIRVVKRRSRIPPRAA